MIRFRIAATALAAALATSLFALDAVAHVLSGPDKHFLERAARDSRAEIELGELARQKGMRDEVKSFAERMVEDHTRAADELARLAQARGIELPAEPGGRHREDLKEMKDLIGPDFDRAYMKRMLDEHEEAVELFEKQAKSAEDPDVRAFAKRQLLALRGHYQAAQGTFGLTTRTEREYGSTKR
jgi:putative membrane protein